MRALGSDVDASRAHVDLKVCCTAAGGLLEGGAGAAVPGQDGAAEGVPPAAGAPAGAAGHGEERSHCSPLVTTAHRVILRCTLILTWQRQSSKPCCTPCPQQLHALMTVVGKGDMAVQDARPSSASSPQILGSGLTREASAASSELSSATDAEAEIRRLTEVAFFSLITAYTGTSSLPASEETLCIM